jgi:hypothetical protein
MKIHTLLAAAIFALTVYANTAFGASYPITKSDGIISEGYPYEPDPTAMVELIHKAGGMNFNVQFEDGSTLENASFRQGEKFVGVTRIVPASAGGHGVMWKETPRIEYAKVGAEYILLKERDQTIQIPPDSFVELIGVRYDRQPNVQWAWFRFDDGALNGGVKFEQALGVKYPFATSITQSLDYVTLLEITPMASPNVRVVIEGSDDLVQWLPLLAFQFAPGANVPNFFRAVIDTVE